MENAINRAQNPLAAKPIGALIARFSIPAIISMTVGSLYNIVDQIFVGQGVGQLGNAATTVAFPVTIVCMATALLLGIGSASNFNIRSGAGLGITVSLTGQILFLFPLILILPAFSAHKQKSQSKYTGNRQYAA